jgi:hypothetical protein
MKKSLLLLLSLTGGAALSLVIWSQTKSSISGTDLAANDSPQQLLAQIQLLKAENARLLAAAAKPENATATATPLKAAAAQHSGPAELSPEEIFKGILNAGMDDSTPNEQALRKMLVGLERLIENGPASVPLIADYLKKNEDLYFGPEGGPNWRNPFGIPLSLREGLIDALRKIGGKEAESALAATLRGATSGEELLSVTKALNAINPGKHNLAARTAAQELLNRPADQTTDQRQQNRDRVRLYETLASAGDTTAYSQLGQNIFTPEGFPNRQVLDAFESPAASGHLTPIYEALNNPELDPRMRGSLMRPVIAQVGADPKAGEYVQQLLLDPNVDDRIKERALGGLDQRGLENPTSPTVRDRQVLQYRNDLLDKAQPQISNPKIISAFDRSRNSISGKLR